MAPLKIAIIGAGIAGCTLARLLQHRDNIEVVVFEGEKSFNIRSQGGTLDLRTKTGLAAIKAAGLYDEFLKFARYDGESLRITDRTLKCYMKLEATSPDSKSFGSGRPEIDRLQLRKLLLESVPAEVIRWNHRLRRIDKDLNLHFDDKVETGFSLVVGADGAWSKIRPILSSEVPQYTGLCGAQFCITDPVQKVPELNALVNRGSLFSYGGGKSMTAQQMGDGSLYCSALSLQEEGEGSVGELNKSNFRDVMRKVFDEEWAPLLRETVDLADEDTIWPLAIYALPVGHRWESKKGVTLIGDAAHLTSPFAGVGANIAMEDAMKLAESIIKAAGSETPDDMLFHETQSFEKDMFVRAYEAQELSMQNLEAMFLTPGAPATAMAGWMYRGIRSEFGWGVALVLKPFIHLYFFLRNMFL